MGLGVTFGKGEGPIIARPLRTAADYDAWQLDGVLGRIDYLPRAVAHLKQTLKDRYGILGFAGAPFTLFAYCVEGGGSDDFREARTLMHRDPGLAKRALNTIADVVADLLLAQVAAGADCVQLFDSWGGLLAPDEYREFALPALQRITAKVSGKVPTLLFVRGGHHLMPLLGETGVTGFSLDWRTEWQYARQMYPNHLLQGNIDPILLLGDAGVVRRRTRALLETMKLTSDGRRCILNLGHGILPGTPPENVAAMVETRRNSPESVDDSPGPGRHELPRGALGGARGTGGAGLGT